MSKQNAISPQLELFDQLTCSLNGMISIVNKIHIEPIKATFQFTLNNLIIFYKSKDRSNMQLYIDPDTCILDINSKYDGNDISELYSTSFKLNFTNNLKSYISLYILLTEKDSIEFIRLLNLKSHTDQKRTRSGAMLVHGGRSERSLTLGSNTSSNSEPFLSSVENMANDSLNFLGSIIWPTNSKPHLSDLLESAPGLIHTCRSSFLEHKMMANIKNSKETSILDQIDEQEESKVDDYIKPVEIGISPVCSPELNSLKIWTGTWNMGAKSLFPNYKVEDLVKIAPYWKRCKTPLDSNYDSTSIYQIPNLIPALPLFNSNFSSSKSSSHDSDPLILPMLISRKSISVSDNGSSNSRRSITASSPSSKELYKSLAHFTEIGILPETMPDEIIDSTIWRDLQKIEQFFSEYDDIYVLGVQEGINDTFFQLCEIILSTYGCVRLDLPDDQTKLFGRGDGSFISPKFTGIAVYIKKSIANNIHYLKSACSSLGFTEGSKGAVAVALRIYNQSVVFVSSHLSANDNRTRSIHYQKIVETLGNKLGEKYFQLLEQFHHVIWFGDLNLRISGIDLPNVLRLLENNDCKTLFKYDELVRSAHLHNVFDNFVEPPLTDEFYPTYKKFEHRPLLVDKTVPKWTEKIYRSRYMEPWYKSGVKKDRIPSFCDRVLVHSLPDCINSLTHIPNSYLSHDQILGGSDHSAVSCRFIIKGKDTIPRNLSVANVFCYNVTVNNISLIRNNIKKTPLYTRFLFPLPYEDGNDQLYSFQVHQEMMNSQFNTESTDHPIASLSWNGIEKVDILHLAIKIHMNDEFSTRGYCVVPLTADQFINNNTIHIVRPATRNGLALYHKFEDRNSEVFAIECDISLSMEIN